MQNAIKKRREASLIFQSAGRNDLVEIEESEILILEGFLPQQMSRESIQHVIDKVVKDVGAASIRDIGKVMKVVQMKIDVSVAPTKLVSALVKQSLSSLS
jgi:uncharacterized protein YqeY